MPLNFKLRQLPLLDLFFFNVSNPTTATSSKSSPQTPLMIHTKCKFTINQQITKSIGNEGKLFRNIDTDRCTLIFNGRHREYGMMQFKNMLGQY